MSRPGVGNPGNKGGGRKSAYQEMEAAKELQEMWDNPDKLQEAMEKIAAGKPALKHIFMATAAQDGGLKLLDTIAKKYFPDRIKAEATGEFIVKLVSYDDDSEDSPQLPATAVPATIPEEQAQV